MRKLQIDYIIIKTHDNDNDDALQCRTTCKTNICRRQTTEGMGPWAQVSLKYIAFSFIYIYLTKSLFFLGTTTNRKWVRRMTGKYGDDKHGNEAQTTCRMSFGNQVCQHCFFSIFFFFFFTSNSIFILFRYYDKQ